MTKVAVITDTPLLASGIVNVLAKAQPGLKFKHLYKARASSGFKKMCKECASCYLVFHFKNREDSLILNRLVRDVSPNGLMVLHGEVIPENIEKLATDTTVALLPEDSEEEKFREAFARILQGKNYFSEQSGTRYLEKKTKNKNDFGLSPRELEVLSLMASGLTVYAISFSLGISTYTVRNHIQSIYNKLGVNDRVNAVLKAIKYGLIEMEKSGTNWEENGFD